MSDLEGKSVLITGSSTGIGAAAAVAFGERGAKVAVHGNRNRDWAEAVAGKVRAGGGEAITLFGDVRDTALVESLVRETHKAFGAVDVLINNAGDPIGWQALEDVEDAFVLDVFQVNALSVIAGCRAAVPLMREAGGGSIINLSSIAARTGGSAGLHWYAASKAYVASLTRGLATAHAKDGIRVNAISPGVIATPIHERHTPPEIMEKLAAPIPMGRVGRDEECAGALLFLASEKASGYISGQVIEINGGTWGV